MSTALVHHAFASARRPDPPDVGVATPRRSDIDVLRVITMLAVFLVHAAEPFNPWDAWHVQSPERTKWLGELVLLLAPWVMPLFILLAGGSAWYSLGKRSGREYLHERVTRLIVPLAAGVLLLVPPQVYFDRRQRGLFDGPFLEFYPHFFDGIYPAGNFTWSHLWFLGVLAVLALITFPLFRWLRTRRGRRVSDWLVRVCAPPGALLLLALPMVALRGALWAVFPDAKPVIADWSQRTTLLATFVYGYLLAGDPRLMRLVDRQWKLALAVALAFSAAMFAWAWPGDVTTRFATPFSARYVMFWSAYTLGGWAWSVALLGAVRALDVRAGRVIDRARQLLNPFYMLHQTVIVVLAFYLVRAGYAPLVTFGGVMVAAFAATYVLCRVVERWRLTRILFGIRHPVARAHLHPARG